MPPPNETENLVVKFLNGIYALIKDFNSKDVNEIKVYLKSIDQGIKDLNKNLTSTNTTSWIGTNSVISGSTTVIPPEILANPIILENKVEPVKPIKIEEKPVIHIESNKPLEETKKDIIDLKEKKINLEEIPIGVISEEDKKKVQQQIQERLEESARISEQVREAKRLELEKKFPSLKQPQWFEDNETKQLSAKMKLT